MTTVYRTIGRAKAQQRRVSVSADRGEGHNGRPLYPVTDDPRETKGEALRAPPPHPVLPPSAPRRWAEATFWKIRKPSISDPGPHPPTRRANAATA